MDNEINTEGGVAIQGDANTEGGDFIHGNKFHAQLMTINNNGLSYSDVKEIAHEVYIKNFPELSERAANTANERAKELVDKFLQELKEQNPTGILQAQEPAFQYSLLVAQREYALSGDGDLADLLVDLLVDRTKEEPRSLPNIVLSESLSVVSKLTPDQIAAITLIFTIRYRKWKKIGDQNDLANHIRELMPLISSLPRKYSAYQHLEFTRCCIVQMGELTIAKLFLNTYPGLWCKGFSQQQLAETAINPNDLSGLMMWCLNDKDLLQLATMNEEEFRYVAEQKGLEPEETTKLIALQNANLMNEQEVNAFLQSFDPALSTLTEIWDKSALRNIKSLKCWFSNRIYQL